MSTLPDVWGDIEDDDVISVHHYYAYSPPGVGEVFAVEGSAFIGEVDETTVMKYPLEPGGDTSRLQTEKKLLEIVGPHPRIIGLKGSSDTGLYLERAINGTLADYILDPPAGTPLPSTKQRVAWCREATVAVVRVHGQSVIHCDIQASNLLLDEGLHIKLADFQGRHIADDGTVLLDGWRGEPCRYFCPRDDPCDADVKTDVFALRCNIYLIMTGHSIFPDIDHGPNEWHEVEERFKKQRFPQDEHACSAITRKCWLKEYESAEQLLRDIEVVEKGLTADGDAQVSGRV